MNVTLHNSCFAYLAKHPASESLIEEVRIQAVMWGSDNICIERNKKIWLEKMR